MKQTFSSMILGPVALDHNTDHLGNTVHELGGAVYYSGYAASALGHRVCVAPKANLKQVDVAAAFAKAPGIAVRPIHSPYSTVIENVYLTSDRERRQSRVLSRSSPYSLEDIPEDGAEIIHLAGLVQGDISDEMILEASQRALCALDVQSMLRQVDEQSGEMVYTDWAQKTAMLPHIHFLKTDAHEAQILTGSEDRYEAARQLYGWGAREVMITHGSEVIVYNGSRLYRQPLCPRTLTGRTGRGDTCFAGYINERLSRSIGEALLTAAALVSLKMETPGPFQGSREDVEAFIAAAYS